MPKYVVAMDSFKGSLTTFEANAAVRQALMAMDHADDEIIRCPMSDGGEGFCTVVAEYLEGSLTGPEGRRYFMSSDAVAYIESAIACGYDMSETSTPLKKSSFPLGEVISIAIKNGAKRLVIGLGGTSTCDAGVGALQALGVDFTLSDGRRLEDGVPALLQDIAGMDAGSLESWSVPVEAWVDTSAYFYGENGAARIFGPQKGLKQDEVPEADEWMRRMSGIIGTDCIPGEGAAGGLGGALHALLGAEIKSGAEQMIRLSRLRESMVNCKAVFTGEGRFDTQTSTGKLPHVIARTAAEMSVPAVCICGSAESLDSPEFSRIIPVTPSEMSLRDAMKKEIAETNIISTLTDSL